MSMTGKRHGQQTGRQVAAVRNIAWTAEGAIRVGAELIVMKEMDGSLTAEQVLSEHMHCLLPRDF